MSDIYYTNEHEYIIVDGKIGTVGISDYAQGQLGEVVFVDLPEVGTEFNASDEIGVIESVKVASELYSPVSGKIIEVNEALTENPDMINEDSEGNGWVFKIELTDEKELEDLKSENEYEEFLEDAE